MNLKGMGAHKTTMAKNTFLLWILETLADWKINGVLEYFRYMGILQNTTITAILLTFTKKQFIQISNRNSRFKK